MKKVKHQLSALVVTTCLLTSSLAFAGAIYCPVVTQNEAKVVKEIKVVPDPSSCAYVGKSLATHSQTTEQLNQCPVILDQLKQNLPGKLTHWKCHFDNKMQNYLFQFQFVPSSSHYFQYYFPPNP